MAAEFDKATPPSTSCTRDTQHHEKGQGSNKSTMTLTKIQEINVKNFAIRTMKVGGVDYICITDIARQKNSLEPNAVVGNCCPHRSGEQKTTEINK